MVRQARNYLLGAMSGTGLIAVAIAAFVLLVSTQVFGVWPVAGLGGGGDGESVSDADRASLVGESGGAAAKGQAGDSEATPGQRGRPDAGRTLSSQSGGGVEQAGAVDEDGGSGGGAPTQPPGGSSSASSGGGGGSGGGARSSPSKQVTETVNGTVNQVDQTVTGGALQERGVTGTSEEVVEGVAGPESHVGKTVDEAAGAVEGLVGGE